MSNIKEYVSTILKMCVIVVMTSIVAMMLMAAVYLLPRDGIVTHLRLSEDYVRSLNDEENIAQNDYNYVRDTNTNIIMLQEASSPRYINALQDALLSPTSDYASKFGMDWVSLLDEHMNKETLDEEDMLTYPRYWHGYLLFLKPLLEILTVEEISILHGILLSVLTLIVTALLCQKNRVLCIPWIVFVLIMNPLVIVKSFTQSSICYATLFAVIFILLKKPHMERKKYYAYVFLWTGMIVAFMDFLTYPLVAYAIPMIIVLTMENKKWKEYFSDIICYGITFLLGYAGLWIMKWILASIFTSENVILDGIYSVLHRTGHGEAAEADALFGIVVSPANALVRNLNAFLSKPTLLVLGICILVFVLLCYRYRREDRGRYIQNKALIANIGIIGILPILWYVVLYNHSALHPHLEWREWTISAFALLSIGTIILQTMKEKK